MLDRSKSSSSLTDVDRFCDEQRCRKQVFADFIFEQTGRDIGEHEVFGDLFPIRNSKVADAPEILEHVRIRNLLHVSIVFS